MNDNATRPKARPSVPVKPLKQAMLPVEGMVMAVERLRDMARHAGLNRLADGLEDARLEAERQATKARQDEAERDANPADLWRPDETA